MLIRYKFPHPYLTCIISLHYNKLQLHIHKDSMNSQTRSSQPQDSMLGLYDPESKTFFYINPSLLQDNPVLLDLVLSLAVGHKSNQSPL